MDYLRGQYSSSLNSEDLYDLELPLTSSKAKGGTMVLWKHSLDPFITIHSTESSSFLPLVLCLPNSKPSIHITLYLPTRGKESQFLGEIANLKVALDDLIKEHKDPAIFLRGDANASSSNSKRYPLFNHFCSTYNLKLVDINHKTYHHFMGQGNSDSDLDVLLHSDHDYVCEHLAHVRCGQVDQLIDSHHDVLISTCTIPSYTSPSVQPPFHPAPRLENGHHRVAWTDKGIAEYEMIVSRLLPGIRHRWLFSSSQVSTSMLLQSTNTLLSLAASFSNRVVSLAVTKPGKSDRIPKHIRKARNALSKLYSKYRDLEQANASQTILLDLKTRLKTLKIQHRKLVRWARLKKSISRDSKNQMQHEISKSIKHIKNKSTRDIHRLKVGDKMFEGENVPDGFFHSISSLKTVNEELLSSSSSYISASETYKCILKICKSGSKVPPVSTEKALSILKSLRPSVNDFYSITALHYLYGGKHAVDHFQFLLNTAIEDLNNMSVEELNMVWACILFKGHGKDRYSDRSYRTISTCPLVSKGIDSYISSLYSPTWNKFTAETQFQRQSSSHELAALTLTEAISHSTKVLSKPVYVLYLDAQSAFDLALKEFLISNIFEYGIRDQGLVMIDQRLTHRQTVCEWNKVLMGPIKDQCGVEQGGINSSDFYKIYNNEHLNLAQASEFGVELGPDVISAIGQADDVALLAHDLHALQGLVDLSLYFCKKYCVSLCSDKTKLQVFSKDLTSQKLLSSCSSSLNLNGDIIEFVDSTEHVGILRSPSGNLPHILSRLAAHRKSIFSILPVGIAMAHRGNPAVNLKTHSIHCIPVLFSGVGCLALNSSEVKLLNQHINLTVQRLQKLPQKTPHCVSLFLGGHLPGIALYHLRVLSIFGMITRTPGSYCNRIAYYKLTCAKQSSGTWFLSLRDICLKYLLPAPISLLDHPMSKFQYKKLVKSRVTDYWEKYYRAEAFKLRHHSLKYFKPEFMSLSWPHKIWTTCGSNPFEINKAVVQARMLSGRYITDKLSRHWNQNKLGLCTIPGCSGDEVGSLEHYLLNCPALSSARSNAMNLCLKVSLEHETLRDILQNTFLNQTSENIVQFLLDCSSIPEIVKLGQGGDPSLVDRLFYVSRTWCYSIHRSRMNKLRLFQYR